VAVDSRDTSERLGGQELAIQRDDGSLTAVGVRYLLYVHLEIDCADNAVAEHFMNKRLQRRPVNLNHLVEAIDRWVTRYAAGYAAMLST